MTASHISQKRERRPQRRLVHELGNAIVADDPARIRQLIKAGAPRNARPWNGPYTAVYVAVRLRRYRSLETLLKLGATTTRQRTDHDPLEEALRRADKKAFELLIRYSRKNRKIQGRRKSRTRATAPVTFRELCRHAAEKGPVQRRNSIRRRMRNGAKQVA